MLQLERDRGAWDELSPDARREKESSLQMFGQLGRFHNIMSNETIGTLAFLTSGEVDKGGRMHMKDTFVCHQASIPTICDEPGRTFLVVI